MSVIASSVASDWDVVFQCENPPMKMLRAQNWFRRFNACSVVPGINLVLRVSDRSICSADALSAAGRGGSGLPARSASCFASWCFVAARSSSRDTVTCTAAPGSSPAARVAADMQSRVARVLTMVSYTTRIQV